MRRLLLDEAVPAGLKRLLPASQDMQLLHDQVGGVLGHVFNLVPFGPQIH